MTDIFDSSEVPYLQDIINYLPIDPIDGEDVLTYIENITNLITVNYKYGQYQFAYFGVHLLYMTYIYCTVWKISRILPERYSDAVVFARTYSNREKDMDIDNISTIFQYSLIPEKDISKIFKIIDLDKSQISNVGILVDVRNEMAHASGKFEILTEDNFNVKANTILNSIRNIHNRMDKQIRKWFKQILSNYCMGEFSEYDNIKDVITEQMVQNFKLSMNEILICNEMSIKELVNENSEWEELLKTFKKEILTFCEERGYV